VVTTELRNPNATNGEKLFAAVMGGVFGFLNPLATLGQIAGGMVAYNNAINKGLGDAAAVAELGKGEVIGSIIGGALQAGIIGWAASGRSPTIIVSGREGNVSATTINALNRSGTTGAISAVSSLIGDIGGAVVGYQLYQALGMDPGTARTSACRSWDWARPPSTRPRA
jgi:hypothetical protein